MSAAGPHPDWLVPELDVPGVRAVMTSRAGGVSAAPYDSLNLGIAVDDDPLAVAANRARLAQAVGGARPVYLKQVHGARVVTLNAGDADHPPQEADASLTTEPGVACLVQVADCLPVLLAAPAARGVAAAHAGWRGLAGGVVDHTVAALCEAAACSAGELSAWLGPCIGPRRFEVGADVVDAFGTAARHRFFPRPDAPGKWLADLAGLARDRLAALGVIRIKGGRWCTVEDASRFFSFRRDRVTGRMAGCIWIER
ncbi:peptidoglycan editing factor PgeF [Methylibium rhizosphaerae]|uniref:peptidoglycan editing factor PgeF n=1 Tax=Methylibium rhizosphaerae TaxID=2570323 RepID=UPI001FE9C348|nr:peptidoglycan editing factor PgeF [Methylibium rhizosphaerae]